MVIMVMVHITGDNTPPSHESETNKAATLAMVATQIQDK